MTRTRWTTGWERILKAFRMAFSIGTGSGNGSFSAWRMGALPGSQLNAEELAGDVLLNGAVAICLGWMADNFPEPHLRVTRGTKDGQPDPIFDHPLPRLIACPNPHYDGDALWAATVMSYAAHGNAYWLKVREAEGYGRPVELWYLPHWQVTPRWPSDGSEFVRDYVYRVNGRDFPLRPEDVVHFRFGIDVETRLGISRIRPVLREVLSDNEASTYTAALLRNMGIPAVMISAADGTTEIGEEAAGEIVRQFGEKFTGDGRAKPLVPSVPVKVQPLGLTPENLALDKTGHRAEARICGALRIPPMVVGLSVGDRMRSFNNYHEARRAAYQDCLMPIQRRFARVLERALLPDLGDPEEEQIGWDYTHVSALRDDMTVVYQRNNLAVAGGWMMVNEARAAAGLRPDPAGDVYRPAPAGSGSALPPVLLEGPREGRARCTSSGFRVPSSESVRSEPGTRNPELGTLAERNGAR